MGRATGSSLRRRSLGAAAAAVGLAAVGCTTADEPAAPDASSEPAAPTSSQPEPAAPSETPPSTAPAVDEAPDPDEIAQRFAGVEPADWGTGLPGIVSELDEPATADGRPRLALTLDACGGPGGDGFDTDLIEGLIDAEVPATLFVNLRWIDAQPQVIEDLLAEPLFELGNHGSRHVPLSVTGRDAYGIAGTADADDAVREVLDCHERLAGLTGERPRLFRSGTAHYDDVGVEIVGALGETPVGFSVNGDAGATHPAETVRAEVAAASAGAIVIAHMNQPGSGTAAGILAAAGELRDAGAQFVQL